MGFAIERRKKMSDTIMVSVPIDRYEQLITTETQIKTLVKTMLITADLNWKKTGLCFDDEAIGNLIDVFYPGVLETRVTELQEEAIEEARKKEEE